MDIAVAVVCVLLAFYAGAFAMGWWTSMTEERRFERERSRIEAAINEHDPEDARLQLEIWKASIRGRELLEWERKERGATS